MLKLAAPSDPEGFAKSAVTSAIHTLNNRSIWQVSASPARLCGIAHRDRQGVEGQGVILAPGTCNICRTVDSADMCLPAFCAARILYFVAGDVLPFSFLQWVLQGPGKILHPWNFLASVSG